MVHVIKLFWKKQRERAKSCDSVKCLKNYRVYRVDSLISLSWYWKMLLNADCITKPLKFMYSHFIIRASKLNPEKWRQCCKNACVQHDFQLFSTGNTTKTTGVIKPQDNNWSARKSVFMCGWTGNRTIVYGNCTSHGNKIFIFVFQIKSDLTEWHFCYFYLQNNIHEYRFFFYPAAIDRLNDRGNCSKLIFRCNNVMYECNCKWKLKWTRKRVEHHAALEMQLAFQFAQWND